MKISTQENPAVEHVVFAWLPVNVFNRAAGTMDTLWLEKVRRKLVSISGNTFYTYQAVESDPLLAASTGLPTPDGKFGVVFPNATRVDKIEVLSPEFTWLPPIRNDEYPAIPLGVTFALAYDEDIIGDTPDVKHIRVYSSGTWSDPILFSGDENACLTASNSRVSR